MKKRHVVGPPPATPIYHVIGVMMSSGYIHTVATFRRHKRGRRQIRPPKQMVIGAVLQLLALWKEGEKIITFRMFFRRQVSLPHLPCAGGKILFYFLEENTQDSCSTPAVKHQLGQYDKNLQQRYPQTSVIGVDAHHGSFRPADRSRPRHNLHPAPPLASALEVVRSRLP